MSFVPPRDQPKREPLLTPQTRAEMRRKQETAEPQETPASSMPQNPPEPSEKPAFASTGEDEAQNFVQVSREDAAVASKRAVYGGVTVLVLAVSVVLITVLMPIGEAVMWSFIVTGAVFGVYALLALHLGKPTSFTSFMSACLAVALLGTATYFVSSFAGFGANAGPLASKRACDLYYRTMKDNAQGKLLESTYHDRLLEIDDLTQKSDVPAIREAGATAFLHKACDNAGY